MVLHLNIFQKYHQGGKISLLAYFVVVMELNTVNVEKHHHSMWRGRLSTASWEPLKRDLESVMSFLMVMILACFLPSILALQLQLWMWKCGTCMYLFVVCMFILRIILIHIVLTINTSFVYHISWSHSPSINCKSLHLSVTFSSKLCTSSLLSIRLCYRHVLTTVELEIVQDHLSAT